MVTQWHSISLFFGQIIGRIENLFDKPNARPLHKSHFAPQPTYNRLNILDIFLVQLTTNYLEVKSANYAFL